MTNTVNPVLEALRAKHDALRLRDKHGHKPGERFQQPKKRKEPADHTIVMGHVIPYVKMTDARNEKEKIKYPFTYHFDIIEGERGWVIVDAFGNYTGELRVYSDRDECAIDVSKLNVANARALGYKVIG
jgi:metallophosphoesterase superfamily enzyme